MSDSIQSIRFVPQINNIKPKGKTGDKKDKKEDEKGFSKHMSAGDNDMDGTGRTHVKEDSDTSENKEQSNGNALSERSEDDFDNSCGTILDTEI